VLGIKSHGPVREIVEWFFNGRQVDEVATLVLLDLPSLDMLVLFGSLR